MALSIIVSDILLNLDIIGGTTSHQTLLVEGDRLRFDTRYVQWARRPLTGDSREQIRLVIEKTLSICEELLHSYQCNMYIMCPNMTLTTGGKLHHEQAMIVANISDTLDNIVSRKPKVISGLETLSTFERYNQDPEFKIQMSRFSDRMMRICKWAEMLKEIIMKHKPVVEEEEEK